MDGSCFKLRVALVDDHEVFREGVEALLERQGMRIAWSRSSVCLDSLPDASLADVVMMDVSLPGISGIEATRRMTKRAPSQKILILSAHDAREVVVQALLAGATGFALKSQKFEEILAGIRATAGGRFYLAPSIPRSVLDEYNRRIRGASAGVLDSLSPRERQVFDLVIQSRSNRQIARDLGVKLKTVETHRLGVNRKLGVHSAAELVRLAAMHGLLHR